MKDIEINEKVRLEVKFIYDEIVRRAKQAIQLTENIKMTNDQYFIDFLDRLNELSVKY